MNDSKAKIESLLGLKKELKSWEGERLKKAIGKEEDCEEDETEERSEPEEDLISKIIERIARK